MARASRLSFAFAAHALLSSCAASPPAPLAAPPPPSSSSSSSRPVTRPAASAPAVHVAASEPAVNDPVVATPTAVLRPKEQLTIREARRYMVALINRDRASAGLAPV